jgi:hypothetical protein
MSVLYEPRGGQLGCMSRSIILLKRYKPNGDAPREMPGYDGRGASKALIIALARANQAAFRGPCANGSKPGWFASMLAEQRKREPVARESEAS